MTRGDQQKHERGTAFCVINRRKTICVYISTEFQAKGALISQIGFVYEKSTICVLIFGNFFLIAVVFLFTLNP